MSLAFSASAAPGNDERVVLQMADRSVELSIPSSWQVWQVPFRREMRVVCGATAPRQSGQMTTDGIWLSFHAQAADVAATTEELQVELAARVSAEIGTSTEISTVRPLKIGGWPAVRADFAVTARPPESLNTIAVSQGVHILVGTSWGVLEIHALAPAQDFERNAAEFERILATLNFQRPVVQAQNVGDATRDAAKILGTWKAFRSRMTLAADGRLVIKPDDFQLAVAGAPGQDNRQAKWLTGKFKARGDLLFVTWDDGSRLNFRWRMRGDELLLTDHEGQISQLRRILE